MNFNEVADDEHGIQQDEWSLGRPRFGNGGHLEVVGWSLRKVSHKLYVVRCEHCAKDPELFGDGLFKSTRFCLTEGVIPCGCSSRPRFSEAQWLIMVNRQANELGYKFISVVSDWRNSSTKILLECDIHGTWVNTISNFLRKDHRGCSECGRVKVRKPDHEMIKTFIDSGSYPENSKFWRSNKRDHRNAAPFWFAYCSVCQTTTETYASCLQKGFVFCECSKNSKQTEGYINIINDGNIPIAVKFGITYNSEIRVMQQNSKSVYDIKQHAVYKFDSKEFCKNAERECKQVLSCGVVPKHEMPDGYTETTHLYNLEKIIEIYEKHGGIRIN